MAFKAVYTKITFGTLTTTGRVDTIYTVPGGKTAIIKAIHCSLGTGTDGGTAGTFTRAAWLYVLPSGGTDFGANTTSPAIEAQTGAANGVVIASQNQVLSTGQSTLNNVNTSNLWMGAIFYNSTYAENQTTVDYLTFPLRSTYGSSVGFTNPVSNPVWILNTGDALKIKSACGIGTCASTAYTFMLTLEEF